MHLVAPRDGHPDGPVLALRAVRRPARPVLEGGRRRQLADPLVGLALGLGGLALGLVLGLLLRR